MAPDATGDAPTEPGSAVSGRASERLPSELGRRESDERDARAQASRHGSLSQASRVGGSMRIAVVAGAPHTVSGAPAPLTLTETWNGGAGVILNDAPCGVAEASPVEFNDGGTPAVEVGDRQGDLYGLNLQTGVGRCPGWGSGHGHHRRARARAARPTRPAERRATGINGVEVPGQPARRLDGLGRRRQRRPLLRRRQRGRAGRRRLLRLQRRTGREAWNQVVTNPSTDTAPDGGVQASLPIADGGSLVEGGSLGQDDLRAQQRRTARRRRAGRSSPPTASSPPPPPATSTAPAPTTSSSGARQSPGFACGTHYTDGGHVRIYNDHGGLICSADTNEEVDSSPAVGPILPGGAYGIATGTGSFYPGPATRTRSRSTTPSATRCGATRLDGSTGGSPALADVQGNGQLAVVEGTVAGTAGVYALNAATGAVDLEHAACAGTVLGSVTTADLTGSGAQDVIVPTDQGLFVLDGPSRPAGRPTSTTGRATGGVAPSGAVYGFQNAPLVTADADGVHRHHGGGLLRRARRQLRAGHRAALRGARAPRRARADAAGGWPQFHHDAHAHRVRRRAAPPSGSATGPPRRRTATSTVASDGGIFAFGQDFCGSTGELTLNKPVVGMAAVPGQGGLLAGGVRRRDLLLRQRRLLRVDRLPAPERPSSAWRPRPTARATGWWRRDGGIFSLRRRRLLRLAPPSVPGQDIVGMAATPDGLGYWEVSTTGRVFSFGDADARPATSPRWALHLNGSIVGHHARPRDRWLLAGRVRRRHLLLRRPVLRLDRRTSTSTSPSCAMQSTCDGHGYWFVASDGGIFSVRRCTVPRLHGRTAPQQARWSAWTGSDRPAGPWPVPGRPASTCA